MARSPWLKDSLSKVTDTQGINLLFSSRRGHIFLQTDQPIYNPGQGGESGPPSLCLSFSQPIQDVFEQEGCLAHESSSHSLGLDPLSLCTQTPAHLSRPTPPPTLSPLPNLCPGSGYAPVCGCHDSHCGGESLTSGPASPGHWWMGPCIGPLPLSWQNSRGFLVQKKAVRISSKLLFQDDFVIPDISE